MCEVKNGRCGREGPRGQSGCAGDTGGVLTLSASGLKGAEPAFHLSRTEVSQKGAGMHCTVCPLRGKRGEN